MDDPNRDGAVTLYCFTPLVTLLTFVVEAALAVYALARYRSTTFGRLSALAISLLALFQLSEYLACSGGDRIFWTRIAFLAIALPPAIGLHMAAVVTKERRRSAVLAGYALAAGFVAFIMTVPSSLAGASCLAKFVVFSTDRAFGFAYAAYYIGMLAVAVVALGRAWRSGIGERGAVAWLLVGYCSFIVPTFLLYVMVYSTRPGLPSILCGFAIFFSLILVGRILPVVAKSDVQIRRRRSVKVKNG